LVERIVLGNLAGERRDVEYANDVGIEDEKRGFVFCEDFSS
jgi:hypothetical protein